MKTASDRVLELASRKGVLRTRELADEGIARIVLTRLVRAGRLVRIGRGLYSLPDAEVTEHHSLAEAQKRVPHGVVCLLSALRFHEMTTQAPFEVWLAIDRKKRKPTVADLPLRIVRFSGDALVRGIRGHDVEGVRVHVTSPARTVADCFLYRGKIGLEVAIEALRDYRRLRRDTIDELWAVARFRRVRTVIRPYLEALV